MSKWFVGCRVRILYSHNWPELAGKEGRIVGTDRYPDDCSITSLSGKACWTVKPDHWSSPENFSIISGLEMKLGCTEDQMEPILPEGHQPAEWEDTLWNPSHLFVQELEQSKELVCIESEIE